MKMKSSRTAKFIGMIMLTLSIAGTILCLVTVVAAESIGFYTSNPDQYNESYLSMRFINRKYSEEIADYLAASLNKADITEYEREFRYNNTNIRFYATDSQSNIILTNMTEEDINYYKRDAAKASKLYPVYIGHGRVDSEYWIKVFIADELEINDDIYLGYMIYHTIRSFKEIAVIVGILFASATAVLLYLLICAAGHKSRSTLYEGADTGIDEIGKIKYISQTEIIRRNVLDYIPLDVLVTAVTLWMLAVMSILSDSSLSYMSLFFSTSIIVIATVFGFILPILAVIMTTATRIKLGGILRNTIIYRVGKLIVYPFVLFARNTSLLWRTVLGFVVYAIISMTGIVGLMKAGGRGILGIGIVIGFLLVQGAVLTIICLIAIQISKLNKKAQAISEGDFKGDINLAEMYGSLRQQAEYLNSINTSVSKAVEERLKSERMKTELITNVSHDIKTPLTSIINYVDLLKKECIANGQSSDEKVNEYINILEKHSAKLKKLIEDLVEASKASTGNISANIGPINIIEMVNQTMGEYSERLAVAQLTPVVTASEKAIYAMADGRLLWRVLDNLLGNVCKYSQPNTRVFIGIEKKDEKAVIIVKNVSRDILNMGADELLERFVRGDSARTTDGSGLGLSIAQSLMALQKGSLKLEIDGDLFKARLELRGSDIPSVSQKDDYTEREYAHEVQENQE